MPELFKAAREKIKKILYSVYGDQLDDHFLNNFFQLIENNIKEESCPLTKWDQQDITLITYGNSLINNNEKPLVTLEKFLREYLNDAIEIVHILPFFPYSSDDGFSVIDFYRVNPELGTWEDIEQINKYFDIMTDLVINHISSESDWFQNFLDQKDPGKDYFIEMDPNTDLSSVTRPRSRPLLTPFNTTKGKKYVWTTFSDDQIDLNFSNPWVLYEIFKVLFYYIQKGARIIRLDAIAYLWKKTGTSCIHLTETHTIVKLIRQLSEVVDPNVIILTETNVPHKENLSYFGKNYDEAEMIYQFSLPPLLLHALHTGNSEHLNNWAKTIPETHGKGTYLNFTASHDGIGVRPLEGILPSREKEGLFNKMEEFGGYISTKSNSDGSESPYEINITYFDALKGTTEGIDKLQNERFLCSQTIMLALKGIPAFYIHSLLATANYEQGVKETGKYRTINRQKLNYKHIIDLLNNDQSSTFQIFYELKRLIRIRKRETAFHPDSQQKILDFGKSFFAFERISENKNKIICISNITKQIKNIDPGWIPESNALDLICNEKINPELKIHFDSYQTRWIKIPG
jgi:sucrose phosphorylase